MKLLKTLNKQCLRITKRKYIAGAAAILLLVTALVLYRHVFRRPQLAIAFIERGDSESSDEICAHVIEKLVSNYNKDGTSSIGLNLEIYSAQAGTDPEELSKIYTTLSRRHDVLAVIDNCWGDDIKKTAAAIGCVHAPTIFLNANRNNIDFGTALGARLFLGDAEVVREELPPLLKRLITRNLHPLPDVNTPTTRPISPTLGPKNLIFLGESDYELTGRLKTSLHDNNIFATEIDMPGPYEFPSDDAVAEVKQQIATALAGGTSDEAKLFVLNCHHIWGALLLPWIYDTFNHVTVVGYQSIISRSDIPVGNPQNHNELILLGQSARSLPDSIVSIYQDQKKAFPQLYNKDDDLLYVRRCLVAMDLVIPSLSVAQRSRNIAGVQSGDLLRALASVQSDVNEDCKLDVGRRFRTSTGILEFDRLGREKGSNQILLFRNGTGVSYPAQLNLNNVLVPNIQFGFRDIRITDVDISSDTFHADFYFWVRCEEDWIKTLFPDTKADLTEAIPKLFDFSGHSSEGFEMGAVSTQRYGSLKEILFHVSGKFAGHFRGDMYPFDQEKVSIELRVSKPDDVIRITPDQYVSEDSEIPSAEVDGWRILDNRLTVNSRSANEALIPLEDFDNSEEEQYSQSTISFTVRRQFWSPALLILCPLALMTIASLAVLFIKLEEQEHNDNVTVEQQNELTLLCTLAVVTYLISYATLAPRLSTPTAADFLVGFTLFISVMNFVFCAAFGRKQVPSVFKVVTLKRYRILACGISLLVFGVWVGATLID